MSLPLSQQTVLLTGAAQGLGAAIARRFAAEGAHLVLLDYNGEGLAEVAAGCGDRAIAIQVDLSNAADTQKAIDQALQYGVIDTLIHNAAILVERSFVDETFDSFFRTVNVGLQAGMQLAHAVWPGMMRKGGGALVFVSSRSGIEGFSNETAYCAAKHGLEGLSKSLALEGKAHGITSNTITPGMYMRTPMSERTYSDELKRKWVDPDRLAPAFIYLAERRVPEISGQRADAWKLSETVRM